MKLRTGRPLHGTQAVRPQVVIAAGTRQSMEIEGVRLELIGTETAHTKGDLMVWLPDDGVLASGDILVNTINPSFADRNLKKLLGVVDRILQLPFKTALLGHGPLMGRGQVEEFRGLAGDFYTAVETVYKAGGAEADVRRKLDLKRWQQLGRFDAT